MGWFTRGNQPIFAVQKNCSAISTISAKALNFAKVLKLVGSSSDWDNACHTISARFNLTHIRTIAVP
jgi:hypothetical protein